MYVLFSGRELSHSDASIGRPGGSSRAKDTDRFYGTHSVDVDGELARASSVIWLTRDYLPRVGVGRPSLTEQGGAIEPAWSP